MDMSSVEHNMIFNPSGAGTKVKMYHNDRWGNKTSSDRVKGLILGVICQIISRTVTLEVNHPKV